MAVLVRYNIFQEDLAKKVHDLHTDTLRVALTNTAPNVATHTVLADISELTTGGGYTAGGEDITNTVSRSGSTVTVVGVDVVWTSSGGGFGPFRYVVLYNDTPASPLNPLIGYYDYGSSITPSGGGTFTLDFGVNGAFQIQ